ERVDQPAAQVGVVRAVGQVQPGVADRRPDPVGVEGVAHDAVADPVPAADPAGVAHHDDLRAVQLDARGAGRHRRVQRPVAQRVAERAIGDDAGVVVDAAVALGLADDGDHAAGVDDPGVDQVDEAGRVADVPERYLTDFDGFGHAHLSVTTVPARPATASAI